MSVRAICGNCRQVMFECSSDYLDSDYTCKNCGTVNWFDKSRVPTRFVLPQHQAESQTSCNPCRDISKDKAST